MAAPEWDIEPTNLGEAARWFEEAEKHLTEPNMIEYVGARWKYFVEKFAKQQDVPEGWVAYMISSLVADGAYRG